MGLWPPPTVSWLDVRANLSDPPTVGGRRDAAKTVADLLHSERRQTRRAAALAKKDHAVHER